ncbi:MAG TPA: hypothetical protein VHV81_13625 [Steroidobacteraceae bacterium]|nr:hypothetical protein [Steroidobacteraceae bacterium]
MGALLFAVRNIPARVEHELRCRVPAFARSGGASSEDSGWANHCSHCARLLDDDELHCEPDVAFVPTSAERAKDVVLEIVREPLEAGADGYALDPLFLDAH